MPQTATIRSLPAAFRMMQAMQAEGIEWGEDDRQGARDAVAALLRGRMDQLIDAHFERMAELGRADRRNGCYRRWLLTDLGDLLTSFRYPTIDQRKAVRPTNAIERRFRELRRRTRPMGTFQDRISMERILFAVFMHENRNQGLATPFALTHTF